MEELKDSLVEIFNSGKVHIAGLVELSESRNGQRVLRKVGQVGNYTPITYSGGVLIFFVANDSIEISQSRNIRVPIKVVIVTDCYDDYKKFISEIGDYDYPDLTLNMNSLSNYYQYFEEDENKPFTANCFEFSLTIRDNYELCCNEHKRLC